MLRAGLRALDREEMQDIWREWQEAKSRLPQDALTPEIEQDIVQSIKSVRSSGLI